MPSKAAMQLADKIANRLGIYKGDSSHRRLIGNMVDSALLDLLTQSDDALHELQQAGYDSVPKHLEAALGPWKIEDQK
jgi:hypothetical protein